MSGEIHVIKDETLGAEREYATVRDNGQGVISIEFTGIIRIDGERYRVVEREAGRYDFVLCQNKISKVVAVDSETITTEDGWSACHGDYVVLEQVKELKKADHVDHIAHLAVEIMKMRREFERKLAELEQKWEDDIAGMDERVIELEESEWDRI